MTKSQAPIAYRLVTSIFAPILALLAIACNPRLELGVTPAKICGCDNVDITWDTTVTSPRLTFVPDRIPPAGGPVDATGSRTVHVCGSTRITLTGNEGSKTAIVEDASSMSVQMNLNLQSSCAGSHFVEWVAESLPPRDFARGMTIAEVRNLGSPSGSAGVLVRHNSGAEALILSGTVSTFFAGDVPDGVWHVRPTIGAGECPGEAVPIPGSPPPGLVSLLRCPGRP